MTMVEIPGTKHTNQTGDDLGMQMKMGESHKKRLNASMFFGDIPRIRVSRHRCMSQLDIPDPSPLTDGYPVVA